MCGINFTTRPDAIEAMNSTLSHRGLPGRSGVFNGPGFAMGHVRLPIQGLDERFDQPCVNDHGAMTFCGEVFNYGQIDPFAESDVEVLVERWTESGPSCLESFDGFWGFVHWDAQTGRIMAVTDELAKKPLYIHLPTMSISSEIKALALLDDGPLPDELYFSSVAKWGYHIGDRTFLRTVRKLPPASVVEIDLNRMEYRARPWVDLTPSDAFDPGDMLEMAVDNRLVSDVPISLLVSGGLDSSIIYRLVERRTHDFTIFHVDNGEEEFLNMLDIPGDIRVEKLSTSGVNVENALFFNEGSVDLGSLLPQYAMALAIKERCPGTPVVLTGDGADELFGGYRRMAEYDAQHSDVFEELVHYHLPRLDKLSMAATLELRSPFLNRLVIRSALALPYEDRIEKRYLKRRFEHLVPRAIRDRRKHPLKSQEVLTGGMAWRLELIKTFRERVLPRYFKETEE